MPVSREHKTAALPPYTSFADLPFLETQGSGMDEAGVVWSK